VNTTHSQPSPQREPAKPTPSINIRDRADHTLSSESDGKKFSKKKPETRLISPKKAISHSVDDLTHTVDTRRSTPKEATRRTTIPPQPLQKGPNTAHTEDHTDLFSPPDKKEINSFKLDTINSYPYQPIEGTQKCLT
jgi:hypothetical protein